MVLPWVSNEALFCHSFLVSVLSRSAASLRGDDKSLLKQAEPSNVMLRVRAAAAWPDTSLQS